MLSRRLHPRGVVLVAAETLLILGAVAVAAYVRLGEWMWVVMTEEHGLYKALLVAFVCQLCLYYTDLYDFRKIGDRRDLFGRIAQALGAAALILAVVYFWFPAMMIGRGVFMIAAALVTTLIIAWRVAFEWLTS